MLRGLHLHLHSPMARVIGRPFTRTRTTGFPVSRRAFKQILLDFLNPISVMLDASPDQAEDSPRTATITSAFAAATSRLL